MPSPRLRKQFRGRPRAPVRTASEVLFQLLTLAQETDLSYSSLTKHTGTARNTISRWARGENAPSILLCEALAEALGYRLKLEKVEINGHAPEAEERLEQSDVTSADEEPTRPSAPVFTRTNRGAGGRFVRW